ncbi:MAG: TIGR02530 family flagellar biosynthesis protein [Peptostreptococcales bacterium]|jgi:flagellar operon protein
MTYRIHSGYLMPYEPIEHSPKENKTTTEKKVAFKEILEQTTKKDSKAVKISNHAQQRLQQRNIVLEQGDLDKLQKAMENAGKKGAREAVLFYKDTVFLTSIRNNTIITALNSKERGENIFTNIDSAVVVGE